jgi:NOL1/NOP2/fmu family ribosome biogenesis protein
VQVRLPYEAAQGLAGTSQRIAFELQADPTPEWPQGNAVHEASTFFVPR